MRGGTLKKIAGLLLSLLLIFSACSNKNQDGSATQSQAPETQTEQVLKEADKEIEIAKQEVQDAKDAKSQDKVAVDTTDKTQPKKTENKNTPVEPKAPAPAQPKAPTDTKETEKPAQPSSGELDSTTGATQVPDAPIVTQENIVRLSITGDGDKILADTDIDFKTGDTVLDILIKITREKKIHMDFSGSRESAYVKGIDNLYEFDKGPNSGWKYTVNGVYPAYSAGAYKLEKGDIIKWIYVK